MTRAYTVQRAFAFVDEYFDEPSRERVKAEIPSNIRSEIEAFAKVDWVPAEYCSAVLRGVCAAKNDPEGSFNDIVECGKFVSVEATNTFYKLMLKVLTPPVFLNKMQTFWGRDFRDVGTWDVQKDPSGTSAKLTLANVGGLDHIGPVSQGFVTYVLHAMGYKNATCETRGWSLEKPGPDKIEFDLRWG